MLSLMEHMYQELGLIEEFSINSVVFRRFLVSKRTILGIEKLLNILKDAKISAFGSGSSLTGMTLKVALLG